VSFSSPDNSISESIKAIENLKIDLAPGQRGLIRIDLLENWQQYDALRIKATDQYGRHLNTWSWPVKYPEVKSNELLAETSGERPSVQETEKELVVKANKISFTFSKADGTILEIKDGDDLIPLSNGPVFVSGKKKVIQTTHRFDNYLLIIETLFDNNDQLKWTVKGNGLIDLEINYNPGNNCQFAGITFDYPEENAGGMKWLGNGPYRVYKNRMKGVEFGLWEKAYNNTITGESGFEYPEFKGYHSEVYWAKITGKGSPDFKVYIHSKDIFLRMLTPADPKAPDKTKMEYPKGDLSFLHGINAIGTKFSDATSSGPQSNPYLFNPAKIHGGKLSMKLTFDFR
jgi:hypothetical protein